MTETTFESIPASEAPRRWETTTVTQDGYRDRTITVRLRHGEWWVEDTYNSGYMLDNGRAIEGGNSYGPYPSPDASRVRAWTVLDALLARGFTVRDDA